jgi:hypothetical protein
MTEKEKERRDKVLARQAERFHERLLGPAFPAPGILDLLLFRMGRTSIHLMLNDSYRDYRYYLEKGWFDSDYYYPAHLGLLKKSAGHLFDWAGARLARKRR